MDIKYNVLYNTDITKVLGHEKCRSNKIGRESKKVEDHCIRALEHLN